MEQIGSFAAILLVLRLFVVFYMWKSLTKKTEVPLLKVKSKQAISRNWKPVEGYRNLRHFDIVILYPTTPVYDTDEPYMRYEVYRLVSFTEAAEAELLGQYVQRLAADGYFFNRRTRAIRCFDCGAQYPSHFPGCFRHGENVWFTFIPPAPEPEVPQAEGVAALRINFRPPQRGHTNANAAGSHAGQEDTLGAGATAATAGAASSIPPGDTSDEAGLALAQMPSDDRLPDASSRRCRYCRNRTAESLKPCGHRIACHHCAPRFTYCPVCSVPVNQEHPHMP